jgi:hypothetical protein
MLSQVALNALSGARSILNAHPYAWTQRAMARDSLGDHVLPTSVKAECFCLIGAVERSISEDGFDDQTVEAVGREVYDAISNYLTLTKQKPALAMSWNDVPERTPQEVIKLIDNVLLINAGYENAAA